jgi:CelD/BcsL family acetyltransferase involved in cellulose biosynthesis
MDALVVHEENELLPWIEPWDDISIRTGAPFCSPAWMLAWWRHAAPRESCLRTILVINQGRLVGVAPFCVQRSYGGLHRYRLLGAASATPIEPVAEEGRELEVTLVIAEQLASMDPRPQVVSIEGSTPGWPRYLSEAWPGGVRPRLHKDRVASAPVMKISAGGFEDWFSAKSRNFQQQMRRSERALGDAGFKTRVLTKPFELERGLTALAELHRRRWEPRGGSAAWRAETGAMLRDAAGALLPTDRFRLFSVDNGRDIISSQLFIAAGSQLSYWLGGFDERWARYRPGLVGILAAVRDAFDGGIEWIDFGRGMHPYKLRFADGRRDIEWATLVPRGLGTLQTRLRLAPRNGARAVAERLPQKLVAPIRKRVQPPSWLQ